MTESKAEAVTVPATASAEGVVYPGTVASLFLQRRLHDVEFIVKLDDSSERIPAHRVVVGLASPVFETMCFPQGEKLVLPLQVR